MIPNERPKKCQIPQIMLNYLSIIEKRSCDFDKNSRHSFKHVCVVLANGPMKINLKNDVL